jgi:hypothetical protein
VVIEGVDKLQAGSKVILPKAGAPGGKSESGSKKGTSPDRKQGKGE